MLLLINSPARTLVVIELGSGGRGGGGGCNRVHLHIVLLYSVCLSVGVLSCVYVIWSFTYVLRVVI